MRAPSCLSCGATSSAELIRKQPRRSRSFTERSMISSMKRRTACFGGSEASSRLISARAELST